MKPWRPLTSRSTYRGWMWLVLGGAMLMPYMMVAEVVKQTVDGGGTPADALITAQFPLYLAALPVIAATGLFLPVRNLSVLPARTFLGVPVPQATGRRDWPRRRRDAIWFTIHLGVGGILSGTTLATVPFAIFVAVLPFLSNSGSLKAQYLNLGWPMWWGVAIGPATLLALVYLVWAAGAVLRRAAARLLGPTPAEQLAASRARAANLAARNRIARELHDSVGHALSVVTVQSAAAGRVLDTDPAFTRNALTAIEDTARRALSELDTVLGILRTDTPGDTGPSHALDQLPALVASSGIDATVEVAIEVDALPPLVSREAYRIVQEGLTNALRYGAGQAADIRLSAADEGLTVRISNPIPAEAGPPSDGRGITGMRERVGVLGGALSAGPRDGSWVVTATLPLDPPNAQSAGSRAGRGGRRPDRPLRSRV